MCKRRCFCHLSDEALEQEHEQTKSATSAIALAIRAGGGLDPLEPSYKASLEKEFEIRAEIHRRRNR